MTLIAKKVIKDHKNIINSNQIGIKLMESQNTGGGVDRSDSSIKKSAVSHMTLFNNEFSDEAFSLFLTKIERKHNIRSIFAQGNQISKKSKRAILKFIKNSQSIEIIDLRDNKLTVDVKVEIKKACLNKNIRCYI